MILNLEKKFKLLSRNSLKVFSYYEKSIVNLTIEDLNFQQKCVRIILLINVSVHLAIFFSFFNACAAWFNSLYMKQN